MNELQIFNYNDQEIRTIEKDGVVWWVLKDVCLTFGETNYRRVSGRLDDEEKGVSQINTPGGMQDMVVVNEAGLYSALFAMQPEKARGVSDEYIENRRGQLRQFKRWVTHEVLPSIRKHGAYMTADTIEKALLNPDTIIQIATALKEEKEKSKALEAVNSALVVDLEIARPKVDYFNELVDRNLLTNFRETAKQLEVPPKRFVQFLIDKKYIYRDKRGRLMPYAQHVDNGLFEIKESVNDKTQWSGTQTLITPKGRETFRLLCLKSA